jgi:hypothetical protein
VPLVKTFTIENDGSLKEDEKIKIDTTILLIIIIIILINHISNDNYNFVDNTKRLISLISFFFYKFLNHIMF